VVARVLKPGAAVTRIARRYARALEHRQYKRHPIVVMAEKARERAARLLLAVVLHGDVKPKKNSKRLVRAGGRRLVLPSAAFEAWANDAGLALNRAWRGRPPLTEPVSVRALIFRKRNTGDLDNMLNSVGDLLQTCRVIANDRQIRSWDGSRLLVDRHLPRVEITIESEAT
jgi:Holliday junction resolvase RusA-like endonuclease